MTDALIQPDRDTALKKPRVNSTLVQILLGILILAAIAALLVPPIPQDPGYHDFADQRKILAVPNFWNVITNLPFFVAGIFGLMLSIIGTTKGGLAELRIAYFMFFFGTALVALGSGYYHLDPTNESLFWDRLPMTIVFMAFFSIIIGENLSVVLGTRLLWPLIVIGLVSVIYWDHTETLGRGDLRPYALVQFLPVLLIPLILVSCKPAFRNNWHIWAILVTYLIAKIAEMLDNQIYQLLDELSGHSIKHLVGSAVSVFLIVALLRREPVSRENGD